MIETPLEKVIRISTSQVSLAEKVKSNGVKLEQSTISAWFNRFEQSVGASYVLAVSAAVDWQVSPHELRPDLYPHPEDGLPAHLRKVA